MSEWEDRSDKKSPWSYLVEADFDRASDSYKELVTQSRKKGQNTAKALYGWGVSLLLLGNVRPGTDRLLDSYVEEASTNVIDGHIRWQTLLQTPAFDTLSGIMGVPTDDLIVIAERGHITSSERKTLKDWVGKVRRECRNPWTEERVILKHILMGEYAQASADLSDLIDRFKGIDPKDSRRLYLRRLFFRRAGVRLQMGEWKDSVHDLIVSLVEDSLTTDGRADPLRFSAAATLFGLFNADRDFLHKVAATAVRAWNARKDFKAIGEVYVKVFSEHREGIGVKEDEPKKSIRDLETGAESTGNKVKEALRTKRENENWLRRYLTEGRLRNGDITPRLIVLKRWNSVTPMFPNRDSAVPGGGYFLVWGGKGIAIDPGYEFIRQLYNANGNRFTIDDINLILVTHAHDDHTAQTELLYSIYHKMEEWVLNGQARDNHGPCGLAGSEGVLIKYSQLLKNVHTRAIPIVCPHLAETDVDWIRALFGLQISPIPTDHGERPWMLNNTGIGFVLTLYDGETEKLKIGITSDTRYYDSLPVYFEKVDLLLAHVGSYHEPDSKHLGEVSCGNLLNLVRPRLAIVTEFGEELHGVRRTVMGEIKANMEAGRPDANYEREFPVVLPGDTGLTISLPELQVVLPNNQLVNPVDVDYVEDPATGFIRYFRK